MTAVDDEGPVQVQFVEGGVAIVRLNRPAKRNSMVWESWTSLRDELLAIRDEQQVGAVVLAGVGGFFSAGGDLKSTPARGSGPLSPVARLELAHGVLSLIRSLPIPVVAAVEGGAVGIGWSLVLACDLVVAADDAFFSAPFVARGVIPDGGAAWFLVERLGRLRATELALLGARLPAAEARVMALVNELCPAGSAEQVAVGLATSIASSDRSAVELSKRLLAGAEGRSFESFLPLELAMATVSQLGGAAARARLDFT